MNMFLNIFLVQFKAVICMHRKIASKDHKLVYWVAGALSALSVLLEKKARRSELALYVLPRAGESLWYILVNRHLLPDVKNAEVCYNVKNLALNLLSHGSFFVGLSENHAHS